MKQTVEVSQLKDKILEKLNPSGWGPVLEPFLMSEQMEDILIQLVEDNVKGKMNPVLKHAFRAFQECPWKELRVVIVGQDPYTVPNSSDGLAFSGGFKDAEGRIQKQTRLVLNEVHRTCWPQLSDFEYAPDPDLTRWANQGVLLFNSALTCREGVRGSHIQIWDPFARYVIKTISELHYGVVFGFMGKRAKQLSELVSDEQIKFYCEHPSQPQMEGRAFWNSENFFNKANQILWDQNGTEIHW